MHKLHFENAVMQPWKSHIMLHLSLIWVSGRHFTPPTDVGRGWHSPGGRLSGCVFTRIWRVLLFTRQFIVFIHHDESTSRQIQGCIMQWIHNRTPDGLLVESFNHPYKVTSTDQFWNWSPTRKQWNKANAYQNKLKKVLLHNVCMKTVTTRTGKAFTINHRNQNKINPRTKQTLSNRTHITEKLSTEDQQDEICSFIHKENSFS